MTSERWQQVKALLDEALERDETARTLFLDSACEGDGELRREVESLLASEAEIGDFIETPIFRIHDTEEALAAGQRVGAYRILRELGRGGMGSVYLAARADEAFDRRVAIKVLRRGMDTADIVQRFRAERQILANLGHPNIAKLLDGGTTDDGRPYFVLEHVEGQPIDEYCDQRRLPTRQRLELFRQVCSAVHFAHQNLVIHRDLKPGNILVAADGTPKLLDFGIAKLIDPGSEASLTRLDLRPMTPEYASPEQIQGEPVTTASDLYSLAVLLYHLLTGHSPYRLETRNPQQLAEMICRTVPPRPSSVVGRVEDRRRADGSVAHLTPESISRTRDGDPRALRRRLAGDLDNILLMAMRKEPQRRYASVDQLSNDVGRHMEGLPVLARKDTLGYSTAKFVGRHKLGAAAAAAVLLMILGFSAMMTVLFQRAVRDRQRAELVSEFLEEIFTNSDPDHSAGSMTAREMLDRGVQDVSQNLRGQPVLQGDLMETMGRVYRKLGLLEPALDLLTSALELRHSTLDDDDPRTTSTMHNLATVLREMGDYPRAEVLVREALRLQEGRGETENINYAAGLTNLATILEKKEKLDEAEALHRQSLAIKRRLPGIDPVDIARSLNNLGYLEFERKHYDDAERYYRQALAIYHDLAGPVRAELATTLSNFASLLEDRGDLDRAENPIREALGIRRKIYGDRHPKVAIALNNLGSLLLEKGNASGAEQAFREALTITEGSPDANRSRYLRNLAASLLLLGKPTEAAAPAREALALFRANEPGSWRVADAESLLGGSLAGLHRFEEAEPLLLEGYAVLNKDSGGEPKRAAEAKQRLADLYTAWNKPERAAVYSASPRAADRPVVSAGTPKRAGP